MTHKRSERLFIYIEPTRKARIVTAALRSGLSLSEFMAQAIEKVIDKAELEAHRARYRVISTRLFAGRTVIHIIADSDPGDGFTAVQGDLEDVYFSTLSQHRKAA